MASLESIAADQRAVLQMILQRGLGYDEIAGLLGIDRAAVRQRALDGFDALASTDQVPALQRALITDYLLGQLPPRLADEVYDRLAGSEADRDWALAVGEALGDDAAVGLAPLPDPDPLAAPDGAPEEPEAIGPFDGTPAPDDYTDRYETGEFERLTSYGEPSATTFPTDLETSGHVSTPPGDEAASEPKVSRRGGALLLASIPAIVLVVAVVVVGLTIGGGHKKPLPGRLRSHDGTTSTLGNSAPATTSTPATTTAKGGSGHVAAFNLSSPTGAKGTVGVVQVIRVQGQAEIVLAAQGMPANGAHNAYAVWLRNSSTGSSKIVGYLQTRVGKDGKLATQGDLPAGASSFNQILVTLETQPNPSAPGTVVLSGPFREKQ